MNNFKDGCKYSPTCEKCPLPECKAPQSDVMKTDNRKNKSARYKKVVELSKNGLSTRDICKQVGYKDIGDVNRILRESRQATSAY